MKELLEQNCVRSDTSCIDFAPKRKKHRIAGKNMTKAYVTKNLICNIDGTVSYWSVANQQWVCRTRSISDSDLQAMSPSDRNRALFHLTRGRAHSPEISL
jgi:hypothetical protein